MNDPYEILGIGRDATEDEIKTAYRELAKKYHPDNFSENPLSDLAQEKMQEINTAYDAVMNDRKQGANNSGGFVQGEAGSSNFSDVRALISANRLEEAQELLDGVPPNNRDAEWYFLSGSVLYRRGWLDEAYTCFSTAVRMNPNNGEYRAALAQLEQQRGGGFGGGYRTGGVGCSACDICQGLLCADCCCKCCGGGGIFHC